MYVTTLIYPLRAFLMELRIFLPRARDLITMMVKVLRELYPRANMLTTMLVVIMDIITMVRVEKGTKLEKVIMATTNIDMDMSDKDINKRYHSTNGPPAPTLL